MPPSAFGARRRAPRAALAALVAFALALGAAPAARAAEPQGDEVWEAFVADRVELLETLAPPIIECFQRRDSLIDPLSPIFHGCLDWHSAVHAAYSQLAISRRSGDPSYGARVEDKIAPFGVSLLPAEHAYQQAKGLDLPLSENPYGFGWFLVLAAERELGGHGTGMREMADYAAEAMVEWFSTRLEQRDERNYIMSPTHANYSWSLLNLDVWARHTGDEALRETVRRFSLPLLQPRYDTACPAELDTAEGRPGFQPVCLMRLATVAHIWGDHVDGWLAERLGDDLRVAPVTDPSSCHAGGQNFLRAFALHQLHLATGETSYRDNAAELIRYHVGRPDLYIDPSYLGDPGYLCYSHWVAQIGVRAISSTYDEAPSTPEAVPPL